MRIGEPARQVAGGSVVPVGRAAEGAARGGLREGGVPPAAPYHRATLPTLHAHFPHVRVKVPRLQDHHARNVCVHGQKGDAPLDLL